MPWVQAGKLYTLHAAVADIDPPIWRRLEIEGHCDLGELHDLLQVAFGWTNSHMHQFTLPAEDAANPRRFAPPGSDPENAAEDEYAVRLDEVLPQADMNLLYEYDFGDSWQVVLHVEKISDPAPKVKYPRVTAGERHGPLDDSGGPWGWEDNLKIINDPKHEEYEDHREWFGLRPGQNFRDTCDLDAINLQLHPAPRKRAKRKPARRSATKSWQPNENAPVFEIPANVDPKNLRYLAYEITYEAMTGTGDEWPAEIKDQSEDLYKLVGEKPKKAIPRLEALVQKYPDAPRVLNYLITALGRAGHNQRAIELTAESFRRFPDYLFSRINYANTLLQERKTEEAARALDNKFDIGLLYPDRKRFHISEFLSFSLTAAWCLAQRGELKAAQSHYDRMAQMEPKAAQTQTLAKLLSMETIYQGMNRLVSGSRRRRR